MGAILLEKIDGKEHFIAYANGHFFDTQLHYHSVFKEILAVKNGIQKFEYHLIGHHYDCPYPPCRGPHCKHPKLSKTFFPKSNRDTDPDETESSSEDDYMNLRSP